MLVLYHCFYNRNIGLISLRNVILTMGSYYFYAAGIPWIALLLLSSSLVDYVIGAHIHKNNDKKKRAFLLCLSVAFNIGLLAFFKYSQWFAELISSQLLGFGVDVQLPHYGGTLPPGISFYTFQTMSYTIDIYRRKFSPQGTVIDYFAYVAFFPQLIAGPIERAKDLLPQIVNKTPKIRPYVLDSAIFLICWGIVKKVVFADNLGHLVTRCEEAMHVKGAGLVLALAFTFQIYFDFSAYTDIARGSARLFGIRLSRNFLTPYFASSPSEFWNRWHRSLSSWLRDYVYIALGGNRFGQWITLRNLFITMFLAGLWHGAGEFFVLWGLYHGVLLIIYRVLPLHKILPKYLGRAGIWLAAALWFVLVVYGWILFFADDLAHYQRIMQSLFALFTGGISLEFVMLFWGLIIFSLPMMVADAVGYQYRREFVDLYKFMSVPVKAALYVLMFYTMLMMGSRGSYDFIYFQF